MMLLATVIVVLIIMLDIVAVAWLLLLLARALAPRTTLENAIFLNWRTGFLTVLSAGILVHPSLIPNLLFIVPLFASGIGLIQGNSLLLDEKYGFGMRLIPFGMGLFNFYLCYLILTLYR